MSQKWSSDFGRKQRSPTRCSTAPVKTLMVEIEARKTAAKAPRAWGNLRIEKVWLDLEVMIGDGENLFEVMKWKAPRSHLRPLKMETIQRLMSSSFSRSMWNAKEEITAEPNEPAAVEARESQPPTARRTGNWDLLRSAPVKLRTIRPRWRVW